MEAYILLILFFLGLPLAIYLILTDPDKSATTLKQQQVQSRNTQKKARTRISVSNLAAYATLTAIFALMCVLTVLTKRGHA